MIQCISHQILSQQRPSATLPHQTKLNVGTFITLLSNLVPKKELIVEWDNNGD
jgi:hypothetical protein